MLGTAPLALSLGNPVLRVGGSDVPSSFWEPTAWAWFDGRTEVTKTTALTGSSATVANTFFSAWFSVEGEGVVADDAIAGLFNSIDVVEGNNAISLNRVSATAPYNRFVTKSGGSTGLFTTSTEYKNSGTPVNSARWFVAAFIDHVTPTNTVMVIFSGTSWQVVTGTLGNGFVMDWTQVYPLGIGRHNALASTRWWGRMADVFLKNDITTIDLTVAATRNALLVDPTSNGSGLGLGTPNIFLRNSAPLFNAGTNAGDGGTFNSIVDGLVVNYPYTQARVTMDTTQALQLAAATGLGTLTAFTLSAWFKTSASTSCVIFALYNPVTGGSFALTKQSSAIDNRLLLVITNTDTDTYITPNTDGPTVPSNRSAAAYADGVLHHVYLVGSIASDIVECYVDGTKVFGYVPSDQIPGTTNFGDCAGLRIGESVSGANRFNGELGDVFFSNSYLPAATYLETFRGGGTPPILTGRSHAVGGVQPIALAGQGMEVSHWNALNNLGTGGTFTKTGTFA